ncbi:MAG: hypothetical protein COB07_01015 [Sulfurovum sp.]|nr:MAG: hypothetical protein COB07_01015 [Sulfurovum sp.]
MEVAQMLAGHSILVYLFLAFLVGGMIIPFVTAKNPQGFRKGSFIYTMIFQAIATMVAFSGLVAVFTGDLGWATTTIIMVAVWAVMMYIEIKKYKAIKLANLKNENTHKVLKSAFIKISIIQVLLVSIMIVIMILKA